MTDTVSKLRNKIVNSIDILEQSLNTSVAHLNKIVYSFMESKSPKNVNEDVNVNDEQPSSSFDFIPFETHISHLPIGELDEINTLQFINDNVTNYCKKIYNIENAYEFQYRYYSNEKYKDSSQKCIILCDENGHFILKDGCNFICYRNEVSLSLSLVRIPNYNFIKDIKIGGTKYLFIKFNSYMPTFNVSSVRYNFALFKSNKIMHLSNDKKTIKSDPDLIVTFNDIFTCCDICEKN